MIRHAPLLLLAAALTVQAAGITITDGVTTEVCATVTISKAGCTPMVGPPLPAPVYVANLSARARVGTGDDVLISGLVISPPGQRVLIRGRGPSMASAGIVAPLANPLLQLVGGQAIIATSDNWESGADARAVRGTGLAPTHPAEAAILITLRPGVYTVILSGVGGGVGIGALDIFTLPP